MKNVCNKIKDGWADFKPKARRNKQIVVPGFGLIALSLCVGLVANINDPAGFDIFKGIAQVLEIVAACIFVWVAFSPEE